MRSLGRGWPQRKASLSQSGEGHATALLEMQVFCVSGQFGPWVLSNVLSLWVNSHAVVSKHFTVGLRLRKR